MTNLLTKLRDGDVYFWAYKEVKNPGQWGDYHCKSQKAVARNGVLYDTYWGISARPVPLDRVNLVFQGNLADLRKLRPGEELFYRSEDIVDMRHANSSREAVYAKPGASRDPDIMLDHAEYLVERTKSSIRVLEHRLEELTEDVKRISAGDLDGVYPKNA